MYHFTLSRVLVTIDRVWIGDHLQVMITNNYNTIADLYTTNRPTLSLLSLLSLVVAW
jgi:hypothetical protein